MTNQMLQRMVLSFCIKTFLVPLHPSSKIRRVWNRPLSLAVWEASLSERFFTFFIDSKIIHVYALQKSEINLELIDKKRTDLKQSCLENIFCTYSAETW